MKVYADLQIGMASRSSMISTYTTAQFSHLQLIRTPGFHRGVGWIHKRLQEARYGKSPEDMGGTKLDTGISAWYLDNLVGPNGLQTKALGRIL